MTTYRKKRLTKPAKYLAAAFLAVALTISLAAPAFALTVLYDHKTTETVTKGVTYTYDQQVTDAGLLDIHVLKIPLDDPYITVGPATSTTDCGLKETVTKLLTENGAIAGTNGDFFGLAGDYSGSFGPEVKDGQLLSLSTAFNVDGPEYSAFFLDDKNNPFMQFMQSEVHFYNDGKENISVNAINKVSDFVFPVIVTPVAMSDTSSIDSRFPGLLKVVVSGDKITYVSQKGETVKVPSDGYVLVIQEASADWFGQFFKAGQSARLEITTTGLDLNSVYMAIGGGGRILDNGQVVSEGTIPSGRQPRTAIGISQDKKTLYLVEVDGRSYSVGATNDDMGQIMLSYGAYNAMHLDGGGSSTMVVQDSGTGDYQVVNNLSDGVQRKVMNAFGVFSSAPQGGIAQIVVQPAVTNAFKGIPFSVDVYGLDAYYHRIDLDPAQFALTTDDPAGVWNGDGTYTPGTAGTITFTATYQDVGMSLDTALTGTAAVGCETLEQLDCNTGTIKTVVGGKTALTFTGMGGSGNRIPVTSGVTYEVSPASIGHMDGGTFVADASGVGSIKCAAAGIPAYVAVYSGGTEAPAYNFDGNKQLQFNSYPDGVTGSAQYTASTHTADADSSAELDYDFPVNDSTQAAYMDFTDPITFADTVTALKMWVSGDGNGYWLRGRLTDADGDQFTIDFAKTVDWTGWKQLTAAVPSGLTYPVVLDRIYIASLNNTQEVAGKLYFDGMTAVSPIKGEVTLPDTPKYTDDMRADLSGAPGSAQDITAVGNATWTDGTDDGTLPQNYDAVRAAVLASLERDCGRGLYMGDTGYDYKLDGFSAYQWNTGYCMHRISNTAVLQMTAAKGGILASNPDQWAKFSPDVAAMNPDNIIVELDINPLDNWSKEFDLFQQALAGYVSAGKNVFVVSHDGYDTSVSSKDGVRYINLGSLWNADGTRNPDFRVLRFRVDGKNITYDLEKAW